MTHSIEGVLGVQRVIRSAFAVPSCHSSTHWFPASLSCLVPSSYFHSWRGRPRGPHRIAKNMLRSAPGQRQQRCEKADNMVARKRERV